MPQRLRKEVRAPRWLSVLPQALLLAVGLAGCDPAERHDTVTDPHAVSCADAAERYADRCGDLYVALHACINRQISACSQYEDAIDLECATDCTDTSGMDEYLACMRPCNDAIEARNACASDHSCSGVQIEQVNCTEANKPEAVEGNGEPVSAAGCLADDPDAGDCPDILAECGL